MWFVLLALSCLGWPGLFSFVCLVRLLIRVFSLCFSSWFIFIIDLHWLYFVMFANLDCVFTQEHNGAVAESYPEHA